VENKSYIVAVDIGSSKVVVAVGSTTDMKTITVEAIVKEATDGVSAGLVDNSQSVSKALRNALDKVEESLQIKISDAYACLSGKFVRSARYTDHVFVEDAEICISQPDLKALNDRMLNVKAPDDEFILDLYRVEYKNDAGMKLAQPVGAYSKQLSATYNFILCERSAKDRLRRVFTNANISHPKAVYASGSVIAESLASNDEKQEGVAIVDIGCGVTDIAVYYGGVLCHMASLPIGSSALNDDIQHFTTNLPAATVEKLKVRHGAALATSKPEVFAKRILDHFGLSGYFDEIVGSLLSGERVKKGDVIKEALYRLRAPEKKSLVMVGDRHHDVIGAKENGIISIGVLYGYGSKEELTDAGADYIAENIEELKEILL
jgi:cell division protein FtsA